MPADYRAQLDQRSADRELAAANLKLAEVKAGRVRMLYRLRGAFHELTAEVELGFEDGSKRRCLGPFGRAGLVIQNLTIDRHEMV